MDVRAIDVVHDISRHLRLRNHIDVLAGYEVDSRQGGTCREMYENEYVKMVVMQVY